MEVFPAFFGSEVAGDAAAGHRHQKIDVHGINLDYSVLSGRKKALAVGSPSDANYGSTVRVEGDEFTPLSMFILLSLVFE